MSKMTKRVFLASLFAASGAACFYEPFRDKTPEISFSKFQRDLDNGKITAIFLEEKTAWCGMSDGSETKVFLPPNFDIAAAVKNKKVNLTAAEKKNLLAQASDTGIDVAKKCGAYGTLIYATAKIFLDAGNSWQARELAKNRTIEETELNAFHEAAHAVGGIVMPGLCEVGKITIKPDGLSLGSVDRHPRKETKPPRRSMFENELVSTLAGRAMEKKMCSGDFSAGAEIDLKMAKEVAQSMVTQFGMSDGMGPVHYGEIFSGLRGLWNRQFISRETLKRIDEEVEKIIKKAERDADVFVTNYRPTINLVAKALLEKETLSASELRIIVGNEHPETTGIHLLCA